MKQIVREFVVGTAHYHVSGKDGDEVILQIDYKNNTYNLQGSGKSVSWAFEQEVSAIAKDLLRRKHGVNFAQKVTTGSGDETSTS